MPSTNKKTPVANLRKKVTVSARARTSVRKSKKPSSELHGSYIQQVSTVTATVKDTVTTTNPQAAPSPSNDAILSLLQEMNRSNQDIVRRIDALERQQSANSTPIVLRSQSRVHCNLASFLTYSVPDSTQGHQADLQNLHVTAKDKKEHGDQGKKRIVYDDLTLTQWGVGQLTNVHEMKDPGVMRQALLQTIFSPKRCYIFALASYP